MLVSIVTVIISSSISGYVSGYRTPNKNSPKLPFSLSPVYTFRLATREIEIYNDLKAYNSSQPHNLPLLEEYLQDYEQSTMKRGQWEVDEHPLLIYRMIRRFIYYVHPIIQRLTDSLAPKVSFLSVEKHLLQKLEEKTDVFYPEEHHLQETLKNLMRIQYVADLKAVDMVSGRFLGIETGIGLTPEQTFEYAEYALQLGYFTTALDFVNHPALDYTKHLTKFRSELRAEIIFQHDSVFDEKIKLGDLQMFQKPISKGLSPPLKQHEQNEWEEYVESDKIARQTLLKVFSFCNHQRLPKVTTLKCWKDAKSHPYFAIAPVLTEQIHQSPDMFLFHEVIGDKATKALELAATPHLERDVVSPDPDTGAAVSYAWFPSSELNVPLVPKLEGILNLLIGANASEQFRYTLFHLGGDADHHQDSFRNPIFSGAKMFMDRVASFMLYLGDMELGGEIVFPKINVIVKPQKGTLLFWYNYHKNGMVDWSTTHGVCPPILGIKKYISSFIKLTPNMFKRPCGRTPTAK